MTHDYFHEDGKASINTVKLRRSRLKVNKKNGRNWIHMISGETLEKVSNRIDIVLESSGNESHHIDFVKQLEDMISEISEQYGGVLCSTELWKGVAFISLMLESNKLGELIMHITFLPEVEKVDEGLLFGTQPESGEGVIGILPYPLKPHRAKTLRVILKDDSVFGY